MGFDRSEFFFGGLSVCELHVQAATKVVAEVAKRKRDKKEAVAMAVAKARGERRLEPLSGIGMFSPLCWTRHDYLPQLLLHL